MDYNPKTHLKLLNYAQCLRKNGKSLRDEDKTKYLKLLNYSVKLSDHIDCKKKFFNI
jgi:hypothetical protein